jgi:hypothetical protein
MKRTCRTGWSERFTRIKEVKSHLESCKMFQKGANLEFFEDRLRPSVKVPNLDSNSCISDLFLIRTAPIMIVNKKLAMMKIDKIELNLDIA